MDKEDSNRVKLGHIRSIDVEREGEEEEEIEN